MLTIKDIHAAEENIKINFLYECLAVLRNNLTSEETFYGKKFKTGVGPNKFHFSKIQKRKVEQVDLIYWIDNNNIFQYASQLEKIFYKYQYMLNKQGV